MLSIEEAVDVAAKACIEPSLWRSIVINRRKPHTYRAFLQLGDSRICLHRFEACEPADSFAHPHPWPSAMLILSGEYEMVVGHTPDLSSTEPTEVIRLALSAGSIYHMRERQTWHQVIPRSTCYSLMVNGPRWDIAHQRAPSTTGKQLEPMDPKQLSEHLEACHRLLANHTQKSS